MRDLMNQRPGDFVAELILRKAQFQVWAPEDVDDIGQLAGVIGTTLGQRQTEVKAEQALTVWIQSLVGFIDNQHLDIVQTLVNPIWQAGHRLLNNGFELAVIHAVLAIVL